MEFSVHKLQKMKVGVHIAQAVLIFITWIMDIVVFRKASINGGVGWHFGLCFLSVVPIIYLTMTSRFPRTRKFANPYALMAVDLLFAILWLSAFATVTNWNAHDLCGAACGASKGVSGVTFIIWLLWVVTTAMSVYGLLYYRREGYLPGGSRAPANAHQIDPDKDAFSTAPHDDEYAPVNHNDDTEMGGARFGGRHSPDHLATPSEVPSYSAPSYHSNGYNPPSVHDEPTGYTGYAGANGGNDGRAKFPTGRYDNL